MKIACKEIIIDSIDGKLEFEIGKMFVVDNTQSFTVNYITWDVENKIIMVKSATNIVKLYNYNYIEVVPLTPFPQRGLDVNNWF